MKPPKTTRPPTFHSFPFGLSIMSHVVTRASEIQAVRYTYWIRTRGESSRWKTLTNRLWRGMDRAHSHLIEPPLTPPLRRGDANFQTRPLPNYGKRPLTPAGGS